MASQPLAFPAFLAAANPMLAQSGDASWDAAFAEWMRRDALADADLAFGAYAVAISDDNDTRAAIASRYGSGFQTNPAARAELDASFAAVSKAEEIRMREYLEPMWAAAMRLVEMPAPNLAAALFKIEVIKREDLGAFDVMDLVKADLAAVTP